MSEQIPTPRTDAANDFTAPEKLLRVARDLERELATLKAQRDTLREALESCDGAFVNWQLGQIPGRPEDILALISKVREALTLTGEAQV